MAEVMKDISNELWQPDASGQMRLDRVALDSLVRETIFRYQAKTTYPDGDPLDMPLPCKIDLGGLRFGKGVRLGLLVNRARVWKQQAGDAFLAKLPAGSRITKNIKALINKE